MKKCLLCVLSAVLIAAALPVSAYGYPETALPDTASWETAPEGFDAGELERELRERMGAGEDTGDMDILPEVSAELMDQMAQMQSIIHPVPKIRWDEGESMVYYTLPNEEYFSSSIPNGMLTTVYRSGMKSPLRRTAYTASRGITGSTCWFCRAAAKMETAACTRSIFIFPLFRRCRPRSAF